MPFPNQALGKEKRDTMISVDEPDSWKCGQDSPSLRHGGWINHQARPRLLQQARKRDWAGQAADRGSLQVHQVEAGCRHSGQRHTLWSQAVDSTDHMLTGCVELSFVLSEEKIIKVPNPGLLGGLNVQC